MREYPAVDRRVLEAAQQGDSAAFAEIYRTFYRFMRGVVKRRLRKAPAYRIWHRRIDLAVAEDITQETFISAFRAIERFDINRPLIPWLVTIAANRCRNHINRRPKGMRTLDLRDSDGDYICERDPRFIDKRPHCNPGLVLQEQETKARVSAALDGLSERRRMVVSLRLIEEFTCDEIAGMMQLSKPVVQNELHRGKLQLRELLEEAR